MQTTTITWADAIQPAATQLATRPTTWTGLSGETITGTAVARYLDAVADLLATRGWIRSHTPSTDTTNVEIPDDESMTVKDMLRTLLGLARTLASVSTDAPRLTLWDAMGRTSRTDAGDFDIRTVAERVLDALVKARTGASGHVSHIAWSERTSRTWDDIAALLAAGAELAHKHGPA